MSLLLIWKRDKNYKHTLPPLLHLHTWVCFARIHLERGKYCAAGRGQQLNPGGELASQAAPQLPPSPCLSMGPKGARAAPESCAWFQAELTVQSAK